MSFPRRLAYSEAGKGLKGTRINRNVSFEDGKQSAGDFRYRPCARSVPLALNHLGEELS